MPRLCQFGRMLEGLHFALTSDELGQPTPGRALQPRAYRPQPGHFVDVDLLSQTLYPGRSKRFNLEEALDQPARLFGYRD